jgi:hypothetical protein
LVYGETVALPQPKLLLAGILAILGPKEAGINELSKHMRLESGHSISYLRLDADLAAAACILFRDHRHSAVAARRVVAERNNNTELGP